MTIAVFATQGRGSNDERRIAELSSGLEGRAIFDFRREAKWRSSWSILNRMRRERPRLVIMEGTGAAGGMACLAGRLLLGIPYVVSSGDAVGPFIAAHYPGLGTAFRLYEKVLYGACAGFIGWTPYLVGRAVALGAPRGMTAAGWAHDVRDRDSLAKSRTKVRARLGFSDDDLVFGLLGSLVWNRAKHYCYGLELVEAVRRVTRKNVRVLIAGGGSGLGELERRAADLPAGAVTLAGEVPAAEAMDFLSAMDVASLPQSMDHVGMFRYTTKICEYLAAGLPVVTARIPMAYDLDGGWCWRLPGKAPWGEEYIGALAQLMERLSWEELAGKAKAIPRESGTFDFPAQRRRVEAFVNDLLADIGPESRA